ncbi:MAG: ATP-dependent DNA helicase [Candidatus ainarchaeum sp.]|nr:ATP-dependent DNA helicase [Candidatus ainarchaeum sp.]
MTKQNIYFRHDSFRKDQDTIIKDIYTSISHKKNILLHAPTGTGKTDASLSAAITYAVENKLKVLFLTPKISQHKIALEAINGINNKYNLKLNAIDFVGKKNMCIDPVISKTEAGFYDICKRATKKRQCPFFENIRPAEKSSREILNQRIKKALPDDSYSHIEIKEIAGGFKEFDGSPKPICAYELAKIKARESTVIIADYYHVFSGSVSKSTLPELDIDLSNCIVVVDEAHNLEERLLKLSSKALNTYVLNRAIKEAKDLKNSKLKNILTQFLDKIESISEEKLKKEKEQLITKEQIFFNDLDKNLFEIIEELETEGLKYIEEFNENGSALISTAIFLEEWITDKADHIRFIKKEKNYVSVRYNALDVTLITRKIFDTCYSAILMSATLTPLKMYQEILGLPKEKTNLVEYSSPFDPNNKINLLISDVSTKFTQRTDEEYNKISKYVNECINSCPGNIVVFFPSFEILYEIKAKIKCNKPVFTQEEKQTSVDFEKMIKDFKNESRKFGAVLLAVMGGKASEGIDLPGTNLISAVIVGIPLSRMELETKAKIDYYEKKYRNGWQYAYIQPAIQKVIQSAGRVIRSDTDKGIIVYMDNRYLWENYKNCFSKDHKFKISKDPNSEYISFFKR